MRYGMKTMCAALIAIAVCMPSAKAEDKAALEFVTVIKDHKFSPDVVEVPAGEKFTLIVKNQDNSAEEFESHDLKREKVIPGGKEGKFKMGPLKEGEYKFFGEFNEATAQGKIVAKKKQ